MLGWKMLYPIKHITNINQFTSGPFVSNNSNFRCHDAKSNCWINSVCVVNHLISEIIALI